ncbi:hypothetical protein PC129_g20274 [Phytophthora cactorum]|uniref:Uncharacterized protein n=2 Tax=Phytophthora cactorum TaxID=29920 RepID=A0A329REQ9_9STRA|nr:hypothetical protein Pcac1_g25625 [Phytophthora cactorum]KAG2799466.1 hypothetical protein PC111_g20420 [Phytophthora cactorum]KAG2802953.1 hypothetical protein PC112_g19403 [Phytophthora cactorum]KAG2831799.1 hypothetical protein PC113_g20871 [Phytophthora cactorum]KAG2878051.1 hypothetical protein PC114_g23318 [Phytophthora cactorum]
MEQDGNTDEGEETLLSALEIHEQESFAAALGLTSLHGMPEHLVLFALSAASAHLLEDD